MQKLCRIDTELQAHSGMDEDPGVRPEIYEEVLNALRNLGDATKLAKSALSSSCVVSVIVMDNPAISRPEALQTILTELLDLLDLGAKEYAVILRARFWERMTLQEFCDSQHNPENLAIRTIQEKQKAGINRLAAWFIEREAACIETVTNSPKRDQKGPQVHDAKMPPVEDSESPAIIFDETGAKHFSDNFSEYQIGHAPTGWKLYGDTSELIPVIERVQRDQLDRQVLSFPSVKQKSINKDLVLNQPVFKPPYQITVQFRFLNEPSDRAGLIMAWQGRGRLIRVQANLFWNHIEFWEYSEGPYYERKEAPLNEEIVVDADYWLRVIASKPDQRRISVYWSADGLNFSHILTTNCRSNLEGKVGLSTSGPNLPQVNFSQLELVF